MLTYTELVKQPVRLQALTSLRPDEFEALLPYFAEADAATQSAKYTQTGQPRQRKPGGGSKARLARLEDKLLFILIYQKTYPLQTAHGLLFGLSQSQTNEWLQRLLPVLHAALTRAGYAPERDPAHLGQRRAAPAKPLAVQLDGTERPRQRPQNPAKQRAHYSGKKKFHTDKNVLLVDEDTRRVLYLSATRPGSLHDKKLADDAALQFPRGSRLIQDTGFQGYAPAQVHIIQPKKQMRGQWLSATDHIANRLKARARILVEHVVAGIKRCRTVKEVLRNRLPGFSDLVMDIACALHNLRNDFRYRRSPTYQLKHYFR